MARKRGGLAGLWDRNKQFIKPIATLGAGALTGGVGGAIVGGLMSGLDREGKSGIGFDVKKGAMGAAQGYGMGKLGAGLKSGVMNRLGASAAQKGLPALPDLAVPDITLPSQDLLAQKAVSAPISSSLLNAKTGVTPWIGNTASVQSSIPAMPTEVDSIHVLRGLGAKRDMLARAQSLGNTPALANAPSSGVMSRLGGVDGKAIKAIGDMALGGYNAVQQNRQMQMERDQMNRRNRLEDEQLERTRAMDPVRAQLLAAMFQRLGLGGAA